MEKPELTKEESELYMKIVKAGDMDVMFDFGVLIGGKHEIKKQLDNLNTEVTPTPYDL